MEFVDSPVPSQLSMLSIGAIPTSPSGFTSSSESPHSTTGLPWHRQDDCFLSAGMNTNDFDAFINFSSSVGPEPLSRPDTPEEEKDARLSCNLYTLPDPKSGHRPGPINTLIKCAILGSPERKLKSADIRNAIVARFPSFFEDEVDRNHLDTTVRHNLSHAPQFALAPKMPGVKGKGRPWMYDPDKDPQVQRFTRRVGPTSPPSRLTPPFESGASRRSNRKQSRNSTILPSRSSYASRPVLPARPRTSGGPSSNYATAMESSLFYSQPWIHPYSTVEHMPSPSSSGYDSNRSDAEWSNPDGSSADQPFQSTNFGYPLGPSRNPIDRQNDDHRYLTLDPRLLPPSAFDGASSSTPNLPRYPSYDPPFDGEGGSYRSFGGSE